MIRNVKTLVHRPIQKIPLTMHYLFGFASAFTKRPDRSVCVDAPVPWQGLTGKLRTVTAMSLDKPFGRCLALILTVSLIAMASGRTVKAQATDDKKPPYVLSTATTGGAFHQGGVGLSALIKIKLLPFKGIDLTTSNSFGSMENIARLGDGTTDFAILQALLGHHALHGTGPANALGPQRNLRAVTMLWPNVEHFIVRKDAAPSGSIEDLLKLRGKRLSFGREASAIESNRFLLENLGLNIRQDFDQAFLAFQASVDAFNRGDVDGLSLPASTPVPAFVDLMRQLGPDAAILNWTEADLKRADGGLDLWSPITLPADTYPGQTEPINTIAQPNFLAVRADVDEEVVYDITKAIFQNLQFLARLHEPFEFLTEKTALAGLPVPLHPGARRFFEEINLLETEPALVAESGPAVDAGGGPAVAAESDYDIFGQDAQNSRDIREDLRRGVVSLMIPEDGTSDDLTDDLVEVLAGTEDLRVLPLKGRGTAHNLADLLYLNGVDISVLQVDAMEFARRENIFPNLTKNIRYITKWHDLELHLLVRDDILSLDHLKDQPVNFGPRGSGSEVTAAILFNNLRVPVQQTSFSHDTALEKLKDGEIAGMVHVAGKPVPLLQEIEVRDGLRLLSLPKIDGSDQYQAATITEADYPTLVFGNRTIDTVSVPSVLAAYNWPTDNQRYPPIANFVGSLFAHLGELQVDGRHAKWRDVDPSFELDLWQRHQAAEAYLRQSRTEEKTIGRGGPLQQPAAVEPATVEKEKKASRTLPSYPNIQELSKQRRPESTNGTHRQPVF